MQVSATKLEVSANPDPKKQAAFCDTLLKVVNNLYTAEDKYFRSRIILALTGLKRVFNSVKVSNDRTPTKAYIRQISVRSTKTRGNTPKKSSSRQLALRAKKGSSKRRSARQLALRSGSAKSRSRSSASSNSRSWRVRTASNASNGRSMNPSVQSPSLNAMGLQLQPSASNSQSLEVDCTGDLIKDARAIAKTMKAGLKNCADDADYTAAELKGAIIAAL
jgi:hypothetical protein